MARSEREVVVTLRLPRELHSRAKEVGGERGLTALIRAALEAKFAGDTLPLGVDTDPTTQRLCSAIATIAREVEAAYGPWHQDPDAFQVFLDAAGELLDTIRSGGGTGINNAVLDPSIDKPIHKPPRESSPLGQMSKRRAWRPDQIAGELALLAAAREGFGW
jgi:hypothetical protein